MAVRGRGSLKFLEDPATLSKKELNKMEKDAERRTADRQKLKESAKKAPSESRRAKVQSRRVAEKNIPKSVRNMMVSPQQDAQNKADSKLKSDDKRNKGPTKSSVEKMIKEATDKGKSAIKGASTLAKLAKVAGGVSAFLSADEVGAGSDKIPAGRRNEFVKLMDAERKKREAELKKKGSTPKTTGSAKDPKKAYSYNEAKKRGLSTYVGKDGKPKATVSADELRKAGYTTGPKGLRKFLNDRAKKAKK
jgi:hypothetical protein